jgi:hypothetical protein
MKRKIILTQDGSSTLEIEAWGEHYHSVRGAIQEAYHVFIQNGLSLFPKREVNILEIGLGTGLNAFITFLEHKHLGQIIHYEGIEAYPLTLEEVAQLNYTSQLGVTDQESTFQLIHQSPWEETIKISESFSLKKRKAFFEDITDIERFDLIYFDAFGARVQPELWTSFIFDKMYKSLIKNGILVTYASKGSARRAMLEVGFSVEKLPGAMGKREMLRALKE